MFTKSPGPDDKCQRQSVVKSLHLPAPVTPREREPALSVKSGSVNGAVDWTIISPQGPLHKPFYRG